MSPLTYHFSTLVLPLPSNSILSAAMRLSIEKAHQTPEHPLRPGTNPRNGTTIHRKSLTIPDFAKHSSTLVESECPLLNKISFNAYRLIIAHNPLSVTINPSSHNVAHQSTVTPILTFTLLGCKSIITAPTQINGSVIQAQKLCKLHRLLSQMLYSML